eukprot:117975-Pleurochrysis_carterae.AAC.1
MRRVSSSLLNTRRTLSDLLLSPHGRSKPIIVSVARPPEPTDVIWRNLGEKDANSRQLRGTLYMLLLSLAGATLIGAISYLQPKVLQTVQTAVSDIAVQVIGLVLLLAGYLVVFIVVPMVSAARAEENGLSDWGAG